MTSSYESYSRAGADEPDVGIPHIWSTFFVYLSLLAPSIADQSYLGRITGKAEVIASSVALVPKRASRQWLISSWDADLRGLNAPGVRFCDSLFSSHRRSWSFQGCDNNDRQVRRWSNTNLLERRTPDDGMFGLSWYDRQLW